MRKTIIATLSGILTLVSCVPDGPQIVRDSSFVISSKVEAGPDGIRQSLVLTLEKGSAETYRMTYIIDSDPELVLLDEKGHQIDRQCKLDFSAYPVSRYVLPYLPKGNHVVSLSYEADGYSMKDEVAFVVDAEPFTFHAEVSAREDASSSSLLISLIDGIKDRDYTGNISIDGEPVMEKDFTVNFSTTPICTIELPVVYPGQHNAVVTMRDSRSESSFEFRFDEPLRYPDMHIDISHDSGLGKTMLSVNDNPYGLKMTLSDSLSVKGKCEWTECSSPGLMNGMTESKEVKDIVSLGSFIPLAGSRYYLTSRDATELRLTSQGHMSYGWEEVWIDDGYQYRKVSYGMTPFKVTSSVEYIKLDIEHLQGVTVHVNCTQSGCVLNGTELTEQVYSFKL